MCPPGRRREDTTAGTRLEGPALRYASVSEFRSSARQLAVGYVPGRTLEQRITAEGALPLADIVRLTAEIGSALAALHEKDVMHRDIKTSNILLDERGTALLTDFGLAKGRAYTALTKPGQVLGTLDYLATELIRGEQATPASDIYGLGCVVYECDAGKAPFGHKTL